MEKETWKAGNMLYPLPAVMVSVSDGEGNDHIITVAWAGTVCTNPPMVSISVRPSRFSYDMLRKTGEFVINLTTEKLAYATDYCFFFPDFFFFFLTLYPNVPSFLPIPRYSP